MLLFYLFSFFFLTFISLSTSSTGDDDLVTSLPGLQTKSPFKHYSGYLNVTHGRHFHYWFVESQSKPADDPVILWLNGGPGCSSLAGMFTELGPWRVNDDGKTLRVENSSWNTIANVIFLESPAGVGFSYQDDNKLDTDDVQTAEDNYQALVQFFMKFPQFKKNPFYITGESYAGVYIPTLAVNVLRDASHAQLNLKGIAIGNGHFNENFILNSRFGFAFNHALIDTTLWEKAVDVCCNNNSFKCNFIAGKEIEETRDIIVL